MSLSLARLLAFLAVPLALAPPAWGADPRRAGFTRRSRPVTLDPDTASDWLLRDLGLRDGRGPSLRQPERLPRP